MYNFVFPHYLFILSFSLGWPKWCQNLKFHWWFLINGREFFVCHTGQSSEFSSSVPSVQIWSSQSNQLKKSEILNPIFFNRSFNSSFNLIKGNFEHSSYYKVEIGILLPKLFWPTVRKKCSSESGLELARVPRVLGTRWNFEHHLGFWGS